MNLRVEPGDTDLRLQLSSYLKNARVKDVPAILAANQILGSCIDHDDSARCHRYVIAIRHNRTTEIELDQRAKLAPLRYPKSKDAPLSHPGAI